MIKVDLSGAAPFFDAAGPDYAAAAAAHRLLEEKSGPGAEFTGWTELPMRMKKGELKPILAAAAKIRSRSKALVVVGIGGSYLGARGAIELLRPLPGKDDPKVFFVGNGLSADYLNCVHRAAWGRRLRRQRHLQVRHDAGARGLLPRVPQPCWKRNTAPPPSATSSRRRTSPAACCAPWPTPRAGSVSPSPVTWAGATACCPPWACLPMAVAGIDVAAVIDQAIATFGSLYRRSPDNPVWQYAAARQHLYGRGYGIELLASYEPSFRFMAEWWKQLYGESEGKNGIGIFPASLEYTADLHSMGQYVQDGPRKLYETVVSFEKSLTSFAVPFGMGDPDGLNYLAGRDLHDICRTARDAVKAAHISGGVPNIGVSVDKRDEAGYAELVCFFELACAISGYMSGVNPFDQPGVEAYKKNMFKMLGKPGA